jgi:hypothetical protein
VARPRLGHRPQRGARDARARVGARLPRPERHPAHHGPRLVVRSRLGRRWPAGRDSLADGRAARRHRPGVEGRGRRRGIRVRARRRDHARRGHPVQARAADLHPVRQPSSQEARREVDQPHPVRGQRRGRSDAEGTRRSRREGDGQEAAGGDQPRRAVLVAHEGLPQRLPDRGQGRLRRHAAAGDGVRHAQPRDHRPGLRSARGVPAPRALSHARVGPSCRLPRPEQRRQRRRHHAPLHRLDGRVDALGAVDGEAHGPGCRAQAGPSACQGPERQSPVLSRRASPVASLPTTPATGVTAVVFGRKTTFTTPTTTRGC